MIEVIVLLLCVSSASMQHMEASPFPEDSHFSMNINMPDVRPTAPDSYICTAKKLDPREAYIVKYVPDISIRTAHHMLLFGCNDLPNQKHLYPAHWSCGQEHLCSRMTIMYGWAKNAPPMELPPDVGFLVGGNSSIHYLVLQIHYANPLSERETDNSGLKLQLTTQRQRYITGIRLLLADTAQIPPRAPSYHIDVNCKFEENYIIHPFAYRVHTHKHGVVVSGYSYNTVGRNWTMLAKGNPQWPQAFYPMQKKHTITNADILAARCTYNTSDIDYPVKIGSSSSDEMCNLYLLYYTEHDNVRAGQSPPCVGTQFSQMVPPLGSDIPLPPDPEMEQRARQPPSNDPGQTSFAFEHQADQAPPQLNAEYIYKAVSGWPNKDLKFGQIAAVAVDKSGNIVLFHRGDHVWDQMSFDFYDKYLPIKDGPITVPTIVTIESATGVILHQWGRDLFYMPHGLFIHADGSYWVTDVALHQVFHFSKTNQRRPILTLGERFVPGNDEGHFCKPASVAVSKSGEIYVADGYCNSRIVRFSPRGKYLSQWGKQDNPFERSPPVGSFRIPHKVVLLEDRDLVCVADRENGRIQCFTMVTGRFRFQIQREEFGGSLYSIAYSKETGLLFAVCGEALMKDHLVRAFIFNVTDQKLLNVFAPQSGTFTRPHDIAVLPNTDEAYVCEIGPNVVWRFMRAYHKSTKKVLAVPEVQTINVQGHVSPSEGGKGDKSEEDATGFETSVVIMCLIAIPILCLVLGTVFVRLRRRGGLNNSYFGNLKGWWGGYRTPPQDKFNLGNLLNPHRGFDRVSLEESEAEQSDSDVEEYSAVARKL